MPKKFLKLAFSLFLIVSFFFFWPQICQAASEEECLKKEENKKWDAAKDCWTDFYGSKKQTLQNEIEAKNTQIELTNRKIYSLSTDIEILKEEILNLGGRIESLNGSLNEVTTVLLGRIVETYKKGRLDPLALLFTADDFSKFIQGLKYLRVMQAYDRHLIWEMESTRTNFQNQKSLKEVKQEELESLQTSLQGEKYQLNQILGAKKVLLSETEASYQQALARIAAEKIKLSGASLFGEPAEFKEWPGDNFYFNQTDSRWATQLIGGGVYFNPSDPSYMWKYGCAVTTMSMVLKKFGVDTDPGRLSQMSFYSDDLIAWKSVPNYFGGQIQVEGHDFSPWSNTYWEKIDQTLAGGNWVIVYVSGMGHYVVLLEKTGDDYRMHDPYFGPDLSFNEKYAKGAVDEMIIYSR